MPAPTPITSAREIFQHAIGIEPINFQGSPNPLAPSFAQGNGTHLSTTVIAHPARIDFTLGPITPNDFNGPPVFPVVENAADFREGIQSIAQRIATLSLSAPVLRVALFVQFVLPVDSITTANQVLLGTIPDQYRVKLSNEEDFVLQVNHPRDLVQPRNVRLNLITKWSVERFKQVSFFAPVVVSGAIQPTVIPESETVVASIGLDYNSAQTSPSDPILAAEQSAILLETLDIAIKSVRDNKLKVEGFGNELLH